MTTGKGDQSGRLNPEEMLASATALLAELRTIKGLTDEQLKAAEALRKQAEEEANASKARLDEVNAFKTQTEDQLKSFERSTKQAVDDALASTKGLLEEITKSKSQAEEALKAAEVARKKADDEATYASQAKNNTETHAKAVATFKGQAEGETATITTNSQKSTELLNVISQAHASTVIASNEINENRKSIAQATKGLIEAAETGTTRLDEVEKAKVSVSAALKESEKMRDEAIQSRNSIETSLRDVVQMSNQGAVHLTNLTQARTSGEDLSKQIGAKLDAAKSTEAQLSAVLAHLTKSSEIATAFEARVSQSSKDLEALIVRVENLLPGATSASLASSFNKQKERFATPQKRWLTAFISCIAVLVVISLPSFLAAITGKGLFGSPVDTNWGAVVRSLTMRLPMVIPLVWLAIYAGRNYMLSLRLEEDYAYKEAISRSFEGYKREMGSIAAADPANPTPISTLCTNVLKAIADPPGRIYESNQQDITLVNEAKAASTQLDELRRKSIATM